MSPITGLLQRSANPISSSFRQAVSMQGPNLAALGLEQLKKTADQFLKEQQATKNAVELYKQKAQESEAACSRIDSLHKKEQAENARLKARLSSDEKQVHDVLQQISQVRHMHNSLLQTLGEANKHLHEVEEQRHDLSVAFDERFRLCEVQADQLQKLYEKCEAKEVQLKSVQTELEATKDAGVKNLAMKEENIQQLKIELQHALEVKAQEIQQLETVIAILRDTEAVQKKKIEELDAEIKHAFHDLQRNDELCNELSSKADMLGTELQDSRKDLSIAAAEIEKKKKESQAAISAHQQQMDSLSIQLSDAVEALQTCKEEWNSKESKLLSEAKEANKKHQQLDDRTALELDKLRTAHRDDLVKLQEKANAEKNKMAEKVKIVTDELMALQEEKAKMEACFEENAKSKQEIDTLTSKIATLLSSNEQAKAELEKVNEKNKEYMTEALETAAKDAEKINYLTAQLTQLETDKKDKDVALQHMQQQHDIQLSALNERIAHQKIMSEQQCAADQAAEDHLQDQLAKRDAMIIQIEEELQKKDMLLQQISMAAAPDVPVIPSPAKRNVATPMRSARVPRQTPPRFVDGPPKGRSPMADLSDQEDSQDNDADDERLPHLTRRQLHDGMHPAAVPKASPAKNSQKRPSPNGPHAIQTRMVLEDGRASRKRNRGRSAHPPTEFEDDFLNGVALMTEPEPTCDEGDDEEYLQGERHSYQTRGRQQKRMAPLSKKRAQHSKAQARAALAASVGKKGRFSTMSAHSLGSDDEHGNTHHKASYEASTLGKRGGYYNSAALDIFGNAAMDPYSFHA